MGVASHVPLQVFTWGYNDEGVLEWVWPHVPLQVFTWGCNDEGVASHVPLQMFTWECNDEGVLEWVWPHMSHCRCSHGGVMMRVCWNGCGLTCPIAGVHMGV